LLIQAKKDGFADRYLARLLDVSEQEIRRRRTELGVVEGWHAVPVSGVENAAYYYSTYNAPDATKVSTARKVMVLGGGPNRIGQGIEFDYCCVHAAFALRDEGVESIMVNCNPETVSTDYDTSNKLYFEPLTVEDVLSIYHKEQPEGVIVQFGGQTPLNIAAELAAAGVKILGTSPDMIELAEDRDRFRQVMRELGIPQPDSGMASTLDEALAIAAEIGYPLMVRPSFVLGGRAMEVVHDEGPFRRFRLRDPAYQHTPQTHRHHPPIQPENRRRAERGRPDEHSVRHLQRHGVHPGGQPSGEPYGAAGLQGVQHPHGPTGHPGDVG